MIPLLQDFWSLIGSWSGPDDVAVKKPLKPEEKSYRFLDARETLDYYGKLFGLEPAFANAERMNSASCCLNGWPTVLSANTPRHDAHRHRSALVNDPNS